MDQSLKRYRAFLSYSQRDRRHARRLHTALESYRLPKGIEANGIDPKSRKIGRIFRDDDEMSAGESLGSALEGAVDDSVNLIVICSPRSAKSRWVDLEVRRFKSQPNGHVFGVIIDGKPNSGESSTECFCPALKERVGRHGPLIGGSDEPSAPDWRKDGLARVRARLVSGLLGIPFAKLWDRDRRRARWRAAQVVLGSLVVATAALVGLTWLAIGESRQASLVQSRRLVERATAAAESGRFMSALRISLAASRSDEMAISASGAEAALARSAQSLLGIVELQNARGARGLKVSPDGARLLGLHDGYVSVWDAETGVELGRQFHGSSTLIGGISYVGGNAKADFLPDAKQILSWGGDSTVRIWNAVSGQEITRQDHRATVEGAVFSSDGSRVLSWSQNGNFRIWDPTTGRVVANQDDFRVSSAAFAPDSRSVAVWNWGSTKFRVFDARSGEEVTVADPDSRPITSRIGPTILTRPGYSLLIWDAPVASAVTDLGQWPAAIYPARHYVVTSGKGNAQLVDFVTGKVIARLDGTVTDAAFSSDGGRLLAWGEDTVTAWDTKTGAYISEQYHDGKIWSAEFSPDGKRAVSRSEDGGVNVWDIDTGDMIASQSHAEFAEGARFSADGKLVLSWGRDGVAKTWDAKTGAVLAQDERGKDGLEAAFLPGDRFVVVGNNVASVLKYGDGAGSVTARLDSGSKSWSSAFNPDGKQVLSLGDDYAVRVWDAATGNQISRQHDVGEEDLLGAQFTPDGKRILSWSRDGIVVVSDSGTGKTVYLREAPLAESDSGATLSPDGSRVLDWSDEGTTCVWEPSKPGAMACQKTGAGWGGRFSSDGKRILSFGWQFAAVWDAATGKIIGQHAHGDDYVKGAIFGPDEDRVASWGGADGLVRIWDAASGKMISQNGQSASGAIFSPDGGRILSWGNNVQLWQAADGKEIAHQEHAGGVAGAAFSADGARVLSWGNEGVVQVWDAETGKQLARQDHGACDDLDGQACAEGLFVAGDTRVLSRGFDGTVRLWDAATGVEIARHRHGDDVQTVEGAIMSADQTRIISWGDTLDVWDAETGLLVARRAHGEGVYGAVLASDGEHVLSWGEDGRPRIWDMRFALKAHGDSLINEMCRSRLAGTGRDSLGRITEADIELAPELKDRLGDDVCRPPPFLVELSQAFSRLLSSTGSRVETRR